MTNYNTQPLLFLGPGSKKIHADFNGNSLTSDAGAVLLREVDKSIGLIDAINRCVPNPRNQFFIAHQQRTMLAQHIFGIAHPGTIGLLDIKDSAFQLLVENIQYLSGTEAQDKSKPAETVLAYDKLLLEKYGSTLVLFRDGHIEICWPRQLEIPGIN